MSVSRTYFFLSAQIRQSRAAELLASPSFHSSGQQQLLQHLQQERLKYLQLEEGSAGERRRIRESQGGIDSEDEVDDDDEGEDQDSDNASSEGEEDQEIRGSGWGLGPRGRSLSGSFRGFFFGFLSFALFFLTYF